MSSPHTQTFNVPAQSVPLEDAWDVVVLGGGPAGCAAAAAAARDGARTLLVEGTGALGGMGTSGLVTAWTPVFDKLGNMIYGGIAEKLFWATKNALPHVPAEKLDWVVFNPEHLKRLYDELVTSAGAEVRFNTQFCSAVTDGAGTVTTAIVANKSGLRALQAKVFVDCTGDGDLAAACGAAFEKGAAGSGEMQPATLCFLVANVDTEAYRKQPKLYPGFANSPIYDILKSGRFPAIKDSHCCDALLWPGVVTFNAGHVWDIDGTDTRSVSLGLLEGRKIAGQFHAALMEFCPEAFGRSVLVAVAPSLGVRETRRIIGDYFLTVEDYAARRKFPDEIGRNNYFIDIHTAKSEVPESHKNHTHVLERYEHYKPGETHGVPYRCLTPKGLKNLLVAGRCISCDRPTQGSIRIQQLCIVMGEAAGAAARLCVETGRHDVHQVDTNELRRRLKRHGAYLPEAIS